MAAVIVAIRSHQPGSLVYQLMTAVAYYAGANLGSAAAASREENPAMAATMAIPREIFAQWRRLTDAFKSPSGARTRPATA